MRVLVGDGAVVVLVAVALLEVAGALHAVCGTWCVSRIVARDAQPRVRAVVTAV